VLHLDVWPGPIGDADVPTKAIDPDFNPCWSVGMLNKSPTLDLVLLNVFKPALPTRQLPNFAAIEIGRYLDAGSAGSLAGGIQVEPKEMIQLINKPIGIQKGFFIGDQQTGAIDSIQEFHQAAVFAKALRELAL
jgi:hypothetical protein